MGVFHLLHHEHQARYDKMFPYLWAYTGLLALAGLLFGLAGHEDILRGLYIIVTTEDALITDYVLVAGPGAALVNSAVVTGISICVLYAAGDTLNGMTLVEMGLMATALAPIVSYIALDNGWGGPIEGILVGLSIGFIMPPLATYTYRIQNGMNLYNVGFACGLTALICVPLMASLGADPTTYYRWAKGYDLQFGIMLASLCVMLIIGGLFFARKPVWAAWAGYRRLLQTSGRAPSDYLRMFGPAPVVINAGANGLIGMAYILLSGGDLNGPTVGGILTIMGFSAFGKHAFNILPVMAGVALGSVVMDWSLTDSAVQLACLFCTTLAPIAGYFGWGYGVLAGFLHSSVVLYTGSPVAGMNLYNNGFSGGLIAIVLYPTIMAIARHRKPVLQEEDYFDQLEGDRPVIPPDPHAIKEEE